jgi:polyhydroxybutyrate depolymerase
VNVPADVWATNYACGTAVDAALPRADASFQPLSACNLGIVDIMRFAPSWVGWTFLLSAACGGGAGAPDWTSSSDAAAGSSSGSSGGSTSGGSGGTLDDGANGGRGSDASVGSSSGSSGGSSSGGSGGGIDASVGDGGGAGGPSTDASAPSSGCGHPWTPLDVTMEPGRPGRSPPMQVVRRSIDVNGVMRQYLVAVPQTYDANKAYALILGFHGSGGDREQLRQYMNLELPANGQAIHIYPSGVPHSDSGVAQWDLSQSSQDLVLVDKLIAQYSGELCIDHKRIFATGHSFGGCMTNAIGCWRGDVLRAFAPVAGCGPSPRSMCVGEAASLQIHSPKDTQVQYGTAIHLCTRWLRAHHCIEMPACGCNWTDQVTTPADQCIQQDQQPYVTTVPIVVTAQDEQPAVLRAYESCDPGYPTVFIDHWHREKMLVGDPAERWHNPPPWSAAVIWEFFSKLP